MSRQKLELGEGPLRILILEEKHAEAERAKDHLERVGFSLVVDRVDSRDDFVIALRDFKPDLVLSDRSIATFDTVAALDILHTLRPATPLIVVSDRFDRRSTVAALRAGAAEVLTSTELDLLVDVVPRAIAVRRKLQMLTARQLHVLRLIAEGLSTPEVARRLKLSVKTVDTHRTAIMSRLDLHDVVALVRYATRAGVVDPNN